MILFDVIKRRKFKMNKKIKSKLFVLCAVTLGVTSFVNLKLTSPIIADAGGVVITSTTSYTIDENGVLTYSGTGTIQQPSISSYDKDKVTEIIIEDGITNSGSFNFCKNLKKVTIPDSVTSIDARAFEGCTSLTKIDIPDSVISIGMWAFGDCTGLTEINIPDGVTYIGSSAFNGCTNLSKATISGDIGYAAFQNCSNLSDVVILNNISSIDEYGFSECTSLTEISIPNSVTSIGDYSFSGCTNLSKAIISGDIGYAAFQNCSDLSDITILDGINSIGKYSFSGCTSLPKIVIPATVASISSEAFKNCTNLKDITIKNPDCNLDDYSIYNGTTYNNYVPDEPVTITGYSNSTAYSYALNNYIRFVDIETNELLNPETKTGSWDENITYTFNDYVLTLSGSGEMSDFTSKNSGLAALGSYKWPIKEIIIEDGITSIGDYAFSYSSYAPSNSYIEKISIPDSVTSIGKYAFSQCSSLTDISIPNSVTSIGYGAFYDCPNLTKINVPNSVTSTNRSSAIRDSYLS
jgi:hypothetical protein